VDEYDLKDEFGRTVEEQLVDSIIWNHWLDRDKYKDEEYISNDDLQSDEDLPFGYHIGYDHGPEIMIEEPYNPVWHKQEAIDLLENQGYDTFVEYF
jgi:hypothetical protein